MRAHGAAPGVGPGTRQDRQESPHRITLDAGRKKKLTAIRARLERDLAELRRLLEERAP